MHAVVRSPRLAGTIRVHYADLIADAGATPERDPASIRRPGGVFPESVGAGHPAGVGSAPGGRAQRHRPDRRRLPRTRCAWRVGLLRPPRPLCLEVDPGGGAESPGGRQGRSLRLGQDQGKAPGSEGGAQEHPRRLPRVPRQVLEDRAAVRPPDAQDSPGRRGSEPVHGLLPGRLYALPQARCEDRELVRSQRN